MILFWKTSVFFSWNIIVFVNSLECGINLGLEIETSCRINGGEVLPDESLTISNVDPKIVTFLNFDGTNFSTLPQNIFISFPLVNILFVSNTILQRLIINDFKNGLNLKTVFFYKTQIQVIPSQIFRNSPNLEAVTFTTSPITKISNGAFGNLRKLKSLALTTLPLTTLPSNMLMNQAALEELNIENCGVTTLPLDFFKSNLNLTKISLTNNKIETLPDELFDPLEFLNFVNLDGNNLVRLSTSKSREIIVQNNQLQELHITAFTTIINADNNFISKITCDGTLNITYASFSNNSMVNFICIRSMVQATFLFLDNNKFVGLTSKAFNNFQALRYLKINDNPNLKATVKMFKSVPKLQVLWVDRFSSGYKNIRLQNPNLSTLYLTTRSWNCSFLKQVANTLNTQKIYLQYIKEYDDFENFQCKLKSWEVSKFSQES